MTDRLTLSASVKVRVEAAEAFAVVSDLRRKARLNPNIEVIRVELEGGEPVREGSVFYHRFRKGSRIVEYRSRCVRFEPQRLFVTRGETAPPFEVRVTVEPGPEGCRLTQEETVEATPALLDALEPELAAGTGLGEMLRWLLYFPGGRRLGAELRAHQRDRLVRRLEQELTRWLEAIREHLEAGRPGSTEAGRS